MMIEVSWMHLRLRWHVVVGPSPVLFVSSWTPWQDLASEHPHVLRLSSVVDQLSFDESRLAFAEAYQGFEVDCVRDGRCDRGRRSVPVLEVYFFLLALLNHRGRGNGSYLAQATDFQSSFKVFGEEPYLT